eukprot:37474-Pyramimonas_sp.AAC.2
MRCRQREYILTTDQSDAVSVGIFSRRTNQMQSAWVYSHDGPMTHLRVRPLRRLGHLHRPRQPQLPHLGDTSVTLGDTS